MTIPGLSIPMTKGQIDRIEWALDPMWDYWCSAEGEYERDDGEGILDEEVLPWTEKGRLFLPLRKCVIEDLLYRLETQLPCMADQAAESPQQATGWSRPGAYAGQKIREACRQAGFELEESETDEEGESDG